MPKFNGLGPLLLYVVGCLITFVVVGFSVAGGIQAGIGPADGEMQQNATMNSARDTVRVEYVQNGVKLHNQFEEFGNFASDPIVGDFVVGKSGCEYQATKRTFKWEPNVIGGCKFVIKVEAVLDTCDSGTCCDPYPRKSSE